MKKLLLLASMMVSIASFASPWDLSPQYQKSWHEPKMKKVYDDPYVTLYQAFDVGYMTSNHRAKIYVEFNQNVGVPYYAIVRLYGDYFDNSYYKDFTVTLTSSQSYKFQEFPLHYWDEIYTEVAELLEYGPQ